MTEDIRVLLVDDDPVDLSVTRRLLSGTSRMRFNVETAERLAPALEALRSEGYDVLLLDLNLPGSRGLATLDAVRRASPDVPIIVLSGVSDEETALQSLDHGAQDYLVKGHVTTDTLALSIRYSIQRHQLLHEITNAKELLEKKNQRLGELYETAHRFVDNVSHEFRTPLTVIKEYVSLVCEGDVGELNEEQAQMLDVVSDRADDLNNMVDDMLDISKLEAGMLGIWRRNCRVSDIVDHIRPSLQKKCSIKDVDIAFDVPTDLPQVYCDDEKIGRVIVNLTTNAIKFSGDPGRVFVQAEVKASTSEVLISVFDNGPGISDENLSAIFERFKQVGGSSHGGAKGFGLGLNIAKELVDLNLGEISVKSQPGHGSTFSFSIPVADPVEVVRRYIQKIQHLHNGSSVVSLVTARADDASGVADADNIDRFLSFVLRGNDLLFRIDNRRWLFVLPLSDEELLRFCERTEQLRQEANQNRPNRLLPSLKMDAVGSWSVNERADALLAHTEQIVQLPEVTHA